MKEYSLCGIFSFVIICFVLPTCQKCIQDTILNEHHVTETFLNYKYNEPNRSRRNIVLTNETDQHIKVEFYIFL